MSNIYVDADACPVKDEIYRVAKRYEMEVIVVANMHLFVPKAKWLKLVVVSSGLDEADNWIAEKVTADDIAITADIPLAARCLESEAVVLDHKGGEFTEDRIGEALASREILAQLRESGVVTGGPAPFTDKDRSQFLQKLDQVIQKIRRRKKP